MKALGCCLWLEIFMLGRVMLSPMVGTPGLALRCATLRICLWHHRIKPHCPCTFWTFNPECHSRNIPLIAKWGQSGAIPPPVSYIHTYILFLTYDSLCLTHIHLTYFRTRPLATQVFYCFESPSEFLDHLCLDPIT